MSMIPDESLENADQMLDQIELDPPSYSAASQPPTYQQSLIETNDSESMATSETVEYKSLGYHWFYTDLVLKRLEWLPFSRKDSNKLEVEYIQNIDEINRLTFGKSANKSDPHDFQVSVRGGRFEVDLIAMTKRAVYWDEPKPSQIRRCLWFHKESSEKSFTPYEQEYSEFLEREYEKTLKTNSFHKRVDYISIQEAPLINDQRQNSNVSEEAFVFHSNSIMMHYTQANMLDEFGNLNSDAKRPRIVKRGIDEVVEKIETDEIEMIDHLCFVIHGIGEGCDMKFRPIEDCVNDMRDNASIINDSHVKAHLKQMPQMHGRVEYLPISWHRELHGDSTGLDDLMKPITLESIPKLRQYSNTTIADVLFYTSPVYCQIIISKVGNEMNRLIKKFRQKKPLFQRQSITHRPFARISYMLRFTVASNR